jgi:hypothetical protein
VQREAWARVGTCWPGTCLRRPAGSLRQALHIADDSPSALALLQVRPLYRRRCSKWVLPSPCAGRAAREQLWGLHWRAPACAGRMGPPVLHWRARACICSCSGLARSAASAVNNIVFQKQ